MKEYLYIIHPLRPGFFTAPTPKENDIMEKHYAYLKQAAEIGTVLLAGPCLDDTFGLVVFRAEDDKTANTFMFNDPSIKADVMMAELHPMHVSLIGKLMAGC